MTSIVASARSRLPSTEMPANASSHAESRRRSLSAIDSGPMQTSRAAPAATALPMRSASAVGGTASAQRMINVCPADGPRAASSVVTSSTVGADDFDGASASSARRIANVPSPSAAPRPGSGRPETISIRRGVGPESMRPSSDRGRCLQPVAAGGRKGLAAARAAATSIRDLSSVCGSGRPPRVSRCVFAARATSSVAPKRTSRGCLTASQASMGGMIAARSQGSIQGSEKPRPMVMPPAERRRRAAGG